MNTPTPTTANRFDAFFGVTKHGSNLNRELLAGISTYLSLAYILVVNPAILVGAGMNPSAVFFATAVASGLATIWMGLYPRLPFALAPGLEMNGFVAVVICGSMGLSWQTALGAVFVSGILCTVLSLLPIREKIVKAIPDGLQANLAVSVGVFVLVIGGFLAEILVFNKQGRLERFGSFGSTKAIALYIGFAVAFLLDWSWLGRIGKSLKLKGGALVPGGFLIAIIAGTIYCRADGIFADKPAEFSKEMFSAIGQMDITGFFKEVKLWPAFLVLFLIDFYGSIGKFVGLTASTNIMKGEERPRIYKAMVVDGVGTVGGAVLGTTSIITYVESAVGITAGGRTGIVAIVCGVLMILSVFLTPMVALVPVVATSGLLVYVGFLLLPLQEIFEKKFHRFDTVVGIAMGAISFFTFSLDIAMGLGFGAYAFKQAIQEKKINWYLMTAFLLITLSVGLRFLVR